MNDIGQKMNSTRQVRKDISRQKYNNNKLTSIKTDIQTENASNIIIFKHFLLQNEGSKTIISDDIRQITKR